MAHADSRIKTLKIKTGVVKRIAKEKEMYEKEAGQIEEKLENMKSNGEDEYVIKKQLEVLQESKAMGPDTKRRLIAAFNELESLVEEAKCDLAETEECQAALAVLEAARPACA